ncbi:2-dehydro-3-deoxygalactonokinase [Citrobacter portucalensis]|uniref:2-dehydro-3-deoxygalactonokinase n=1 Tax=Citrobacter portucalensis TaxID=1639133 RepID=UPI000C9FBFC7|nr:2-dehydro-3-deoxygalactonokinase [Citrobacter portucalensis]MEB7910655.1 2-dehydro-3-deoxygalactonokinase [Citrobacter portucalensis]PKQ50365.1 2-dehydro-3-deoxygalactonokinase [Citrobacter portucalensis]
MKGEWIAIDWGTSNFRAWLMAGDDVLDKRNASYGLLHVEPRQFDATLKMLLGEWIAEGTPMVAMAGMVGSQQGWYEVDYCSLPASADSLLAHSKSFMTSWGSKAWIFPGLRKSPSGDMPDVMRGEEVQLLGLSLLEDIDNFHAILPGTHSKHARMQQRQIVDFSTYMTGELFQVLISHSLLGRGLPDAAADDSAFLLGVEASRRHAALSQLLFSTRTLRLSGELSAESVSDYLSGLLIGLEFSTDNISPVWLVGSAALTRRYQMAANAFGIQTRCVEGDRCFIAGMQSLQQRLTEKRYG